jgi:hypothetical protein|tara:strand:- start:283 stop:495 length:213 start_codon:yes stop_codon:yes gene_type:complete
MANKEKHLLKTPFPLSVTMICKERFIAKCKELDVNYNVIASSLFDDFVLSWNQGDLDKVKDRGKIKNAKK